MSGKAILTVNTGSSSIKLSAYALDGPDLGARVLRAELSDLATDRRFDAETAEGRVEALPPALQRAGHEPGPLVAELASWAAAALEDREVVAVGHRIVHGGTRFTGPGRAEADVLRALRALSVLAPSHQPANLAGVEAVAGLWPGVLQSLSFDTAFHRTQPHAAELYAIPRALSEEGLLRFGFHGLSYAHIADLLAGRSEGRPGRVIVAHLGSGASLCALEDGRSVATTMGLTALDGVPMSTRSGSVDPGLVLHLIQDRKMTADQVAELLYKRSGLLGLSGISGDVRDLLASDAPQAAEALCVFAYRVAREIGSLAAALQGLDMLVFTGGVGENAWQVRAQVCEQLGWLGVSLDGAANEEGREAIGAVGAPVPVLVIPADEEAVIARETAATLAAAD